MLRWCLLAQEPQGSGAWLASGARGCQQRHHEGGAGLPGLFRMGKSFIRTVLEVLSLLLFGLFVVSQLSGGPCRDGGSQCYEPAAQVRAAE